MNTAQLTFVTGDAFNMPGQSCVKCWRVGSKRPENSFLFIKKYIEFPQSRITGLIIDAVLSKRSTNMVCAYFNLVISHKIWVFNPICCKNIRHSDFSPHPSLKYIQKRQTIIFFFVVIVIIIISLHCKQDSTGWMTCKGWPSQRTVLLSGWNLVMFIL